MPFDIIRHREFEESSLILQYYCFYNSKAFILNSRPLHMIFGLLGDTIYYIAPFRVGLHARDYALKMEK